MSASTNQIPGYRGRQALSHQTPRLDTMRRLRDLADDLDELCMYITDTELEEIGRLIDSLILVTEKGLRRYSTP